MRFPGSVPSPTCSWAASFETSEGSRLHPPALAHSRWLRLQCHLLPPVLRSTRRALAPRCFLLLSETISPFDVSGWSSAYLLLLLFEPSQNACNQAAPLFKPTIWKYNLHTVKTTIFSCVVWVLINTYNLVTTPTIKIKRFPLLQKGLSCPLAVNLRPTSLPPGNLICCHYSFVLTRISHYYDNLTVYSLLSLISISIMLLRYI